MIKCKPQFGGDTLERVWVTIPVSDYTKAHLDSVLTLLAKAGGVTHSPPMEVGAGFRGKWEGGADPHVMVAFGYITNAMGFHVLRRKIAKILLTRASEAEVLIARDQAQVWRQVLDVSASKGLVARSSLRLSPLTVTGPYEPIGAPIASLEPAIVKHYNEEVMQCCANFGLEYLLQGDQEEDYQQVLATAVVRSAALNEHDPSDDVKLLVRLEFMRAVWDIGIARSASAKKENGTRDMLLRLDSKDRERVDGAAKRHLIFGADPLMWDDWSGPLANEDSARYALFCFLWLAAGRSPHGDLSETAPR